MSRTRVALGAGVGVVAVAVLAIGGFALLQGGGATPTTALPAPRYVVETAAAGLEHTYAGGSTFWVGGGVAVLDCDSDGRPDLYLAGGAGSAALYRNESAADFLRFTRVADPATDLSDVNGAYPVDIDSDGQVDLAVLRVGENVLLRGLGDCRFERANEAWGIDGGNAWTTAFAATWEDGAALPTLAFGNYLGVNDTTGLPVYECQDNQLVRPDASGNGYGAPTTLTPGYCTLSALFSDWDGSGRRDLRLTNDRQYYTDGQDQLWRVEDATAPRLYTDQDGWVAIQIWGMGIASYDLTDDGYPEVYLTSQGDNKLQTLTVGPAQPTYRDIAQKRGVSATAPYTGGDILPSTAWHPEFDDVNNDGFIDLFVSKGNVSEQLDHAKKDPSNLLVGQPDGTFVEGAEDAGIVEFDSGRGAALVDFDLDGLLDLIEVKVDAPVRLWHNMGSGDAGAAAPMGNWLALHVSQPAPNVDAIGAWLEVQVGETVMRRELTVGGGHIGGQLGPTHVGIGPATEARVRVTWPDGEAGPWLTVKANQAYQIERGATEARPWQAPGD